MSPISLSITPQSRYNLHIIDDLPKIQKPKLLKKYKYNTEYVLNILNEDKTLLDGVFALLQKMKEIFRKIDKDIKNKEEFWIWFNSFYNDLH